ncbi:MAG: tRNA pseudouridine(55) synthase TruB [Mogibacterium sp.]|nr:tRNA pseudouridine(55) synthase TruB [Mogibacterium sp.]
MQVTDGIINVNKTAGWTSQDVCSKLRHVLHTKKIGHTGTLDPMATGVLPVCIGKATRIIEYYDRDRKSYHAEMKLGIETDTLDITGEVLETHAYPDVSENAVREAFKAYTGEIMQVPPKYSALKVDGKRAYDLARAGADFEIKPRPVTIYNNEVSRIDLEEGIIEFDVTCSKGTYIRTICDDIGRALGCGAAMTVLERTASGFFRIEDSYTLDEIIEAAAADEAEAGKEDSLSDGEGSQLKRMIIPADITLENLGMIRLNDNRVTAFMNGNSSWPNGFRVTEPSRFNELYRVYSNDAFLGVAAIENGSLIPKKVIK